MLGFNGILPKKKGGGALLLYVDRSIKRLQVSSHPSIFECRCLILQENRARTDEKCVALGFQ